MKKIIILVSLVAFIFGLQACNNNDSNITATIVVNDDQGIQINNASFNITVLDPDFEITGNIFIYLSNDLATIDTKTYSSADSISVVSFSNLSAETEYTIEIQATVGRNSLTVTTETFTTLAQASLDIETPEDFFAMSNNRSGNYVLKNDIDFTEVEFITPFTSSFIGSFEGNGFTLSNIKITESRLYNGVFGYISSGTVKNVNIDGLEMGTEDNPIQTSSSTKTGFLTGYQASSLSVIENVVISNASMFLSSSSSTYAYVGGIAGESRGRIENVKVENASILLNTTSNAVVRLCGAIGYGYESSQASQLSIDVDLDFGLEAEISTRSNRSFSIYVGGLIGDVDPQSTNSGMLKEMIYEGHITLSNVDYNTNENDKANYSLFVGGAFGVINRSFDMIYIDASIDIIIDAIDVEHDVNQSLRVGGFAGLVNTYYLPTQIVLKGQSITLNYNADQIQARVAALIGLSRLAVIKGYVLNAVVINGVTVDATLNLTTLTSLSNFFDSEYLNEQLLGA
jgi:hypothetical protein